MARRQAARWHTTLALVQRWWTARAETDVESGDGVAGARGRRRWRPGGWAGGGGRAELAPASRPPTPARCPPSPPLNRRSFLRKLRRVKKANGQILACNEVRRPYQRTEAAALWEQRWCWQTQVLAC